MSEESIDPRRLVFPGLAGLYQAGAPRAYGFMRFCTGAVLVPHGIQKLLLMTPSNYASNIAQHGIPGGMLLAWLTILTESFGAAFLAIGLFTRFCAAAIWIEMAVIITVFQWQFGYFWTQKGVEYALLWLLLCTAIFFRGGGRYSVDHYLGREL
ncbi:MAG TPA: DoxX family protein [Stellaceae bacterium]|jgi:putative oxidoreductase|nr:DoxX family protein [Stellaceae bacterium]